MVCRSTPPLLPSGCLALVLLVSGCTPPPGDADAGAPTASVQQLVEAPDDDGALADAGAQQKGAASRAGERIQVPAGKLVAGSLPGDTGRHPALEPIQLELELNAFEIDKLPYPNDPSKPPLTEVTRDKAKGLCEERAGRLCSDLEWERACRGEEQQRYAGGDVFDPACASAPETCASAFGVLAMGAALREWTASEVQPIKRLIKRSAAVRGAGKSAAHTDHRCAHREAVAPADKDPDLGFRCCYGEANSASIASPDWQDAFKRHELSPSDLQKLFASNLRLKKISNDIKYFREEAAESTIMRRGKARGTDAGAPPENTYMTTAPLLWNPVAGEQILLVTGRSQDDSFIVAFHLLPGGGYRVAAALQMQNELGPVVLIYNPFRRRQLHWATCWECYGETGNITYREDNRVVITQR